MTKYSKLIKDFPLLYGEGLSIACRDGWYDLLYELSEKLEKIIKENWDSENHPVAFQVKEKFGGLRFYLDFPHRPNPASTKIHDIVLEYERQSYQVCEFCGSTNDVSRSASGWIKSKCKKCRSNS